MSEFSDYSDADSRGSYGSTGSYVSPLPCDGQPYLEIIEQPQSRGFRFRYECEGKSHGGLQGENSSREKKSYPSVRICRHRGPAKIVVSLVTDEAKPQPHAHELIGKNCTDGCCTVFVKACEKVPMITFPNLGIRHVTKKSVTTILIQRLREQYKIDKMMKDGCVGLDTDAIDLSYEEEQKIQKRAEEQAKRMNLNVARLSFRAHLLDDQNSCIRVLPEVISNPIHDSKAPSAAVLKICRLDKVGGSCAGNEEIFMLCDKVQKDDVSIRFFETDDDGEVKWEAFGSFEPQDVHRQYAIVFRTPAYRNTKLERPVKVSVQLKRLKDEQVSDCKFFTYYPNHTDQEDIQKKRKKPMPNYRAEATPTTNQAESHATFLRYPQALPNGGPTSIMSGRPPSINGPIGAQDPHSRLVTDSVAFDDDFMLARSWPTESYKSSTEEPSDISSWDPKPKVRQPVSPTSSSCDSGVQPNATDATSQDVSNVHGAILLRLIEQLCERASQAVQSYSQTGDERHLLMPSRHLISNKNTDGDNAVHLSVIHGQPTALHNLLDVLKTLPADDAVNDVNDLLQTPLQLAVLTGQCELVDMLIEAGARPRSVRDHRTGDSALHIACRTGNDTILHSLLKHWSDCQPPLTWMSEIDTLNYEGYSALHLAVRRGDLESMRLLVELGKANVNLSDGRSGRTPLHHAVNTDNLAIIGHLILECSADVDKPDDSGNTPLHHAVAAGKVGIVALLMAAGADPDIRNLEMFDSESDSDESSPEDEETDVGLTPRDLACGNDRDDIMRILDGEDYRSVRWTPSVRSDSASTKAMTCLAGVKNEPRFASVFESGYLSVPDLEKLSITDAGDIIRLDALTRAKLGKLLDPVRPREDWRELAARLNMNDSIGGFELQKSPTVAVINNYEVVDGTVAELRKCLVEMNRTDAVNMIDAAVQSDQALVTC